MEWTLRGWDPLRPELVRPPAGRQQRTAAPAEPGPLLYPYKGPKCPTVSLSTLSVTTVDHGVQILNGKFQK